MSPQLITLILNIVLGVFLLFGFLFGLRGLKKATTSLISFIVTTIVVFLLVMPVSNWVLGLNFGGTSLQVIIGDAINSLLGPELAANEVVASVVKGVPLMLVAIVVCWLLILIIGAILKIISNIIYRLIFGKEKAKVVEEVEIVNSVPQMTKRTIAPKKHRFWGGVVGMVHGFLLTVVTFMPIIGLINIVNDIAGTGIVNAESGYVTVLTANDENSNFELKSSKELLIEYLPKEFYDYAKALDNSILAKIGKVGNLSEATLNLVARCEINGYTVKLGEEIRTIVGVYDEFVDFATQMTTSLGTSDLNVIFDDLMENPNNYDFNKLYTLCDNLFNSKLLCSLGADGLITAVDLISNSQTDERLVPLFNHLKVAFENYKACGYSLKDDIKALVGTFEISAKSGLLKQIVKEEFNIDNIAKILLNQQTATHIKDEVLTKITGKICSSNLLQKLLIEANNYGATYLQDLMNENIEFNNNSKVVLPKLDGTKNIKVTSTELTNLISCAYDIYTQVKDIEFEEIINDVYKVFDYNTYNILTLAGEEIENITNMNLFKESGLFTSICDAMSNSEYSKYLSFNELAKSGNIKTQLTTLAGVIEELKNSEVITILKNSTQETKQDDLNLIIDELAAKNQTNTTLATRIVAPVLSCSILKNTALYALDEVKAIIESILSGMVKEGETVTISDFNTTNFMSETDNLQLINIVNQVVDYVKDINLQDLSEDKLIDTILDSELKKLGIALDSIKFSNLFSSDGTNSGVYNDIITALDKTSLGSYIYFEPAKSLTFSWNTTLTSLDNMINDLNQITIDGEGLVKYMIKDGDFNKALDILTSEDVQNLKPLFEISIVRPIAANVVNTINSLIKDFVGEDIGVNITQISSYLDLTSQSQQIADVIAAALDVDFAQSDLDKIDKTTINNLLAKLEVNAEANGVFKESYNALLIKVADMINENIKSFVGDSAGNKIVSVTQYIDAIEDGQNIIAILNQALDTVSSLKAAKLQDINVTSLFNLIDIFKQNTEIADGIFAETYNAILVYMINTVNGEVANYVGSELSTQIETYTGNINVTARYNYLREIVECGVNAFKAVPEGGSLEDISSETLSSFLDALNSTDYTRATYNALNNKLANVVIESINKLINVSNTVITEIKDLTAQADDVKNVTDIALDVVPLFENCSFKLDEMSTDQKQGAVNIMNALQTNTKKADSVFNESYNSLLEHIALANDISSDYIYENYATDGIIDWESLIMA